MQQTRPRPIQDSYEVCDNCGYEGGFHVLLERRTDVPGQNLRLYLKCPNCRTTYDVGWVGTVAD